MKPDMDAIRARCDAATPGPWHGAMPTCDHDHDADDPACSIEDPNSAIVATCVENDADVDFILYARTDIPALLAYVEELEAEAATLRHRDVLLKRVHGALADMCCRVPTGIDEPVDAIVRASLARANQRFVDEYDARVSAEERALTAEERMERVTHERDQERKAFEQAMAEAQTDNMHLRASLKVLAELKTLAELKAST